jgi:hypothetical protein
MNNQIQLQPLNSTLEQPGNNLSSIPSEMLQQYDEVNANTPFRHQFTNFNLNQSKGTLLNQSSIKRKGGTPQRSFMGNNSFNYNNPSNQESNFRHGVVHSSSSKLL